MNLFKIEDVRRFTECLFLTETFDKFCVADMEVRTLVSISIRGNMAREWLSGEEQELYGGLEYVPWKLLRPTAFALIRGKRTPRMMRVNFVHRMENGDLGGFRIQYEKDEMICMSSYTPANFTPDKSGEQLWDEKCSDFLRKNKIISTRID